MRPTSPHKSSAPSSSPTFNPGSNNNAGTLQNDDLRHTLKQGADKRSAEHIFGMQPGSSAHENEASSQARSDSGAAVKQRLSVVSTVPGLRSDDRLRSKYLTEQSAKQYTLLRDSVRSLDARSDVDRSAAFNFILDGMTHLDPDKQYRVLGDLANRIYTLRDEDQSATVIHMADTIVTLSTEVQNDPMGWVLSPITKYIDDGTPMTILVKRLGDLAKANRSAAFNSILGAIAKLPKEEQEEPLNALLYKIKQLPDADQSAAFDRVADALAASSASKDIALITIANEREHVKALRQGRDLISLARLDPEEGTVRGGDTFDLVTAANAKELTDTGGTTSGPTPPIESEGDLIGTGDVMAVLEPSGASLGAGRIGSNCALL